MVIARCVTDKRTRHRRGNRVRSSRVRSSISLLKEFLKIPLKNWMCLIDFIVLMTIQLASWNENIVSGLYSIADVFHPFRAYSNK